MWTRAGPLPCYHGPFHYEISGPIELEDGVVRSGYGDGDGGDGEDSKTQLIKVDNVTPD